MINRFCTSALWECNKTLIAVAQGNLPADLVVRHARLVSTPTREVVDDVDIAIACGRIAYVGLDGNTAEHCVEQERRSSTRGVAMRPPASSTATSTSSRACSLPPSSRARCCRTERAPSCGTRSR